MYIHMLPIQNRGRHVHTYVANTKQVEYIATNTLILQRARILCQLHLYMTNTT